MYILTGKYYSNEHYVYILINPLTNKPFYVGKGCKKRYLDHFKEAITNKGANPYKTNTIKKILKSNKDVIVDIVFTSKTKKPCFDEEKRLIKFYGRKNDKSGILTNLTDGGEGGPYKHTEEHKQKLRENNPGGKATSKPIYQIDAKIGEVIKEWSSSRQAGINLGIKTWRNISQTANKYKNRVVGGFYWRWVGDKNVINNKLINIDELNEIRLDQSHRTGKPVQQISLDTGEVIKVWKNMCEAGRNFGLSNSTIFTAIKYNRPTAGFLWKKV